MAVETLQNGVITPLLSDQAHQLLQELELGSREQEEMVQVFMVVQCYSCKTFQVHQVKKVNKWVCKICNEKQSVLKTYSKGTARECGKHVKKLNMLRGEKERGSGGGGGGGGVRGSHPPHDYANTFTTRAGRKESQDKLEHPVVLADAKKSKWTTFLQPSKDEDEDESSAFTTDKDAFTEAVKSRRKASRSRSMSERKPRSSVSHDLAEEEVCPYSSVTHPIEWDHTNSSEYQDRYTKLGMLSEDQGHSHSMFDLSSTSPCGPDNHREWMDQIRQDLEPFSQQQQSGAAGNGSSEGSGRSSAGVQGGAKDTVKASSRWSKFMEGGDTAPQSSEGSLGRERSKSHCV